MNTRHPLAPLMAVAAITATLLAGGCHAPASSSGSTAAPASASAEMPNFGPPMQDTRTAATIQQMELDYIAAKNSRPTYQHLAAAEQKKKAEAEATAAKQAAAVSGGR